MINVMRRELLSSQSEDAREVQWLDDSPKPFLKILRRTRVSQTSRRACECSCVPSAGLIDTREEESNHVALLIVSVLSCMYPFHIWNFRNFI